MFLVTFCAYSMAHECEVLCKLGDRLHVLAFAYSRAHCNDTSVCAVAIAAYVRASNVRCYHRGIIYRV